MLIPISYCGTNQYFITFTDDFSHYEHVELFREKSDSLVSFKEFKVKMEIQKNKKLKVVRCNRGGEFYYRYDDTGWNLGPFSIYLLECGIDAQCLVLLNRMA